MKEKIINLKNKVKSFFSKLIRFIKVNKKISVIILAIFIVLIVIIALLLGNKKTNNSSSNLSNLGFTLNINGAIYTLGYDSGATDGIYKIKKNNKQKITNDYGYYLNEAKNYIYYIDAIDNNIVKMKTNGKNKTIIVEDVDIEKMVVQNNWIYYFDDSYFYRVKTNGKDKKRISTKSVEDYQIVGNTIYYSYVDNGKFSIAKMKSNGDENLKIDENCGRTFWVNNKELYYIYENNNNENYETKYELYKMNVNGKNKKKIADIDGKIDTSTINFTEEAVYYAKRNDSGELAIYKIKLNGKNETKVADIKGYSTNINVNNKWVYYPDEDENGNLQIFKVRTNGKDKEAL